GAVYRATGTRNIEELGGLARKMPFTWIGFGIGAAAIVGLPPLNGFVSEWLVYQGMFRGADAGSLRLALLGIPALALVGALSGAAGLWWLRGAFVRGASVRREPTWACGYDATSPRLQYTASSFAAPLLTVFGRSTGVYATRTANAFHSRAIDLVLDGVALPV